MSLFYGNWSDKIGLMQDFEIDHKELENFFILLAAYEYIYYEGDAYVLLFNTQDHKLYEVHGSHCSCYGLEGQWEPEETSATSIEYRVKHGSLGIVGEWDFKEELLTLAHSYANETPDYMVVTEEVRGVYFAGKTPNFLPDAEDLVDSTYISLEKKVLVKYTIAGFTSSERDIYNARYELNPELVEWYGKGMNHQEEKLQDVDVFNSRIVVTREVIEPCKRISEGIKNNLLVWMEEHDAQFENAANYNVVGERQVICLL